MFCILGGLAIVDSGMNVARRLVIGVQKLSFSTNSVLLMSELLKLVFSVVASNHQRSKIFEQEAVLLKHRTPLAQHLRTVVVGSMKMGQVAFLYLIASLVSYLSLKFVPSTVFAAISQLKVLTTALFTLLLMKRRISMRKWRILTLLMLSVLTLTLSNVPVTASKCASTSEIENKGAVGHSTSLYGVGVVLCALQTFLTGFASVYMELILKTESEDSRTDSFNVWDRNIQLALWSTVMYSFLFCFDRQRGFFVGWNTLVFLITVLQACGGILVAMCVLYVSSIAKTLAVCASLVLTALMSETLGDTKINELTLLSCFMVALNILSYQDESKLESEALDTGT